MVAVFLEALSTPKNKCDLCLITFLPPAPGEDSEPAL